MLVLGREVDQSVTLVVPGIKPVTIVVKVVRIDGDYIRLGFECPRSVEIYRGEIAPQQEERK